MKMGRLVVLLLLFHSCLYGQIANVAFVGTAAVKGGDSYTYRLQLTDSNGTLSGYSVTDITGPNETKTSIKGTINSSKKQIYFQETKIISTKSKSSPFDFCYMQGHLKVANIKGITALRGNFKGYMQDGKTECATGTLSLLCAKDVLDKLLEIQAKDSARHPKKDTVKTVPANVEVVYEKAIPDADVAKVLPGKSIDVHCPSPIVTLDIWDSKTVDGDIITLLHDNMPVLQNHMITAKYKEVNINMGDKQTDTLTLIAVNEGSEPLNTASIKITSGSEGYYIDATTIIGKNIQIILKRK